jgi:hypothetical protein
MIKIKKFPNGYTQITGCPTCDNQGIDVLWRHEGKWVFDTDNGMTGPEIKFCPFCGAELPEILVILEQATTGTTENAP